ncbi:MAG: SDR family oxidoreductase [Nitrospinae bacterium]|nr:SDR family oxidoreductase [Nitrospinota bacterium]
MPEQKIAVVTGGNKGIGFGICRALAMEGVRTILTARDVSRGEIAKEQLKKEGLEVVFHPLDVAAQDSIDSLAGFLTREFGRLDILINNAAIRKDAGMAGLDVPIEIVREMMEINVYGPLMLCQALAPLLKKSAAGRIVNVSSGMGSLAGMGGGSPAYRITKTALNAMTKVLASEFQGTGVLVNCCHPGWVRTDMGGRGASKSIDEGADTPVWLALLPKDGPTGGYFQDRKPMPW